MPIEVKVVSKADFDTWVGQAKKKFAQNRDQDGAQGELSLAQAAH